MTDFHSPAKRLIVTAGLAAVVAGAAALGGPTAGAQPNPPFVARTVTPATPSISALQVKAGGTEATVSFTTSEPTAVSIEHKRVGMTATPPSQTVGTRPLDGVRAPLAGGGVLTTAEAVPLTAYKTAYQIPLKSLESNTAYDVFVTATTQSGERLSAKTSFTTLKQRVRITLESIDVKDDGDGFLSGDGEPLWHVLPTWDGASYNSPYNRGALCYPNTYGRCEYGEFGEGRITPRNTNGQAMTLVFAEENFDRFPSAVSLKVWAEEDDAIGGASIIECITNPGCPVGDDAVLREWRVPQGVESYSQRITLRGDDAGTGFESVLTFHFELFHDTLSYPWHSRNMPSNTWFPGVPAQ